MRYCLVNTYISINEVFIHVSDLEAIRDFTQRVLCTCDFLDEGEESSLLAEVQIYGESVLKDCIDELKKLQKELEQLRLSSWVKDDLKERIRKRLLTAVRRLQGEPEVELEWISMSAYEGEEVVAILSIFNQRAFPVKCKISFTGDFELLQAQREVELLPLEGRKLEVHAIPKEAGQKTLSVRVSVEGNYPATVTRESLLKVQLFKPSLEAEVTPVVREVEEGEVVEVGIRLRNTGTVPLKIELTHPLDGSIETLTLGLGEELFPKLRAKVPGSGTVKLPPLKYRDPRGNSYTLNLGEVQLSVRRPRAEPAKREEKILREEREEKREVTIAPPPPALDLEGILSQAAAHGIALLIGKIIGERLPEKREFPKPVIVQNLPYHVHEDITVVLEDPAAVVEEDRGSYVLVRKAEPAELEHVVTAETARALVGNYKLAVDAALRSWKPFPEAEASRREHIASLDELRELAKKRKEKAEELEEKLPSNFYIEYTFATGGIRRKTLLKVYAGAYSRLSELCERERDDKPVDVGGAVRKLELPTMPPEDHPTIYLLASPTGWDPSSRDLAEGSFRPLYILVNLKTGELYYNKRDTLANGLAEELRRALGHTGPPIYSEELLNLDKRLLKGEISEEFYEKMREELVKKSIQG
jgi:hypothetical protein